jgi:hypothetical protein
MAIGSDVWVAFLQEASPAGVKLSAKFAARVAEYLEEEYDEAEDVQDFLGLGVDAAMKVFQACAPGKMTEASLMSASAWYSSMVAGPTSPSVVDGRWRNEI